MFLRILISVNYTFILFKNVYYCLSRTYSLILTYTICYRRYPENNEESLYTFIAACFINSFLLCAINRTIRHQGFSPSYSR